MSAVPLGALDEAVRDEVVKEVTDPDAPNVEQTESFYAKQAKQIVAGDQFAQMLPSYLIDCLRVACGQNPLWNTQIEAADKERIRRVQEALRLSEWTGPTSAAIRRPT